MRSDGSPDILRLDRDLPTTVEDVAALRRLRYGLRLAFAQYLQCLAALDPLSTATLRARKGPNGPPFDLLR